MLRVGAADEWMAAMVMAAVWLVMLSFAASEDRNAIWIFSVGRSHLLLSYISLCGGTWPDPATWAPSPLKLDPPRTLSDAWTPTPMSFREGLGAPGSHFHAKLLRVRPQLRQPAAQRVSE
eukprot:COSAG02_NODE_1079_length_14711_cov_86.326512_1_plen_120_part_00